MSLAYFLYFSKYQTVLCSLSFQVSWLEGNDKLAWKAIIKARKFRHIHGWKCNKIYNGFHGKKIVDLLIYLDIPIARNKSVACNK